MSLRTRVINQVVWTYAETAQIRSVSACSNIVMVLLCEGTRDSAVRTAQQADSRAETLHCVQAYLDHRPCCCILSFSAAVKCLDLLLCRADSQPEPAPLPLKHSSAAVLCVNRLAYCDLENAATKLKVMLRRERAQPREHERRHLLQRSENRQLPFALFLGSGSGELHSVTVQASLPCNRMRKELS